MRKTFVAVYLLGLLPVLAAVIFLKNISAGESITEKAKHLQLTFEDGHRSTLKSEKFDNKLIVYYFDSSCEMCFAEASDIVNYAKAEDARLLFVTSDKFENIKAFRKRLTFKGMAEDKFSIARVKKDDIKSLFGNQTAPQSLFFGKEFEVKGQRTEIITYESLASAFE